MTVSSPRDFTAKAPFPHAPDLEATVYERGKAAAAAEDGRPRHSKQSDGCPGSEVMGVHEVK